MMLVIRPVVQEDMNPLYALSAQARAGLTTLPHERDILEERIKESLKNFTDMPEKPGGEVYLFVIEDLDAKKIVGTSSIISKVGGFDPFYTYKIKNVTKRSTLLDVKKKIQYLQLVEDHNGPTEIGTLFLDPEYRKSGNGRLLSLSRFLFIAQYKQCFEDEIIAELRGVIDNDEQSPFWEAIGKHFFDVEFKKADLMVMRDKSFIADLVPKHPIYIPLLPQTAQEVIGKVHTMTQPAFHLLQQEGFEYQGEIDIFEAGPVLKGRRDAIRSVRKSQELPIVEIKEKINESLTMEQYMIANVNAFQDYRVAVGHVEFKDKGVCLAQETADAINVKKSGKVRVAPLRSKRA